MTQKKTTKRALFASVLSLLLCVSMLIGSTFAWFTDTATTGVNKIQSGKLDVALEMYDKETGEWVNAEGKTLNFVAADGNTNILWEPGCTYNLPQLRVVNNGNLWLKYEIAITGIDGDAKLNEAIDWDIVGVRNGALAPDGIDAFIITGHMKEEAGNEYQDLTIEGVSITVYATQYTYESDSIDNQYDAAAVLPELYANGIELNFASEGKHFAGNGSNVITFPYQVYNNTVDNYIIAEKTYTMVKGENTFNNCQFPEGFHVDVAEDGSTITFNNCTFGAFSTFGPNGGKNIKYVFNNCSFEGETNWAKALIIAYHNIELKDCTFDRTDGAEYDVRLAVGMSIDDIKANTAIIVNVPNDAVYIANDKGATKAMQTIATGLYYDGESTYTVVSANGLAAVNGVDFTGKTVKLANDIDLKNANWTTIKEFAGTFDGQGYTVSNLTGNLFGTVSGTVKNLNVENVNILNTTKNGANGFINKVAEGGLIDNCKVSDVDIKWTAEVNAIDTTDGFGGVIASVQAGATVQNCEFSDITVTSNGKTKRTGGVFGGITGTVKDCVFTDVNFNVTVKDGSNAYVTSHGGGLAAVVDGGAVVKDCVINNMKVNVYRGGHLGGIFGKAYGATLKDITVNGLTMNVGDTAKSITCIAGFIAQPDTRSNDVRVTIDNCHIYGLDMTLASSKQGESAAAGFISGLCGGVDITNCSVSGKIDGTNTPANIGGFIGDAGWYGSIEQNITKCVANVNITVKDSIAGGFIAVDGTLSDGTAILNFTECKANGTVTVVDGGTGTAAEFCGKTIE